MALYLRNNRIGDAGAQAIAEHLFGLMSLGLAGNRIGAVPAAFGDSRALRWLDLSGNDIATLPRELGRSRSLQYVFLHENERLEIPDQLLGEEAVGLGDDWSPPNAPAILQWLAS